MTRKLHTIGGAGNGSTDPAIPGAADIEALWLDPAMGDGITDTHFHTIPVGKPKDFFRTVPDPAYRRRTEIYVHKPEGMIEEAHYVLAPAMRKRIEEAQPCTLVTVVYRDGSPRIWPVKLPKEGEHDNEAWVSARRAVKVGMKSWTKLIWVRKSYITRNALPGYAPDPDFSKLPPFNDLIALAFGEDGIIRDTDHHIYRELFGSGPASTTEDDGGELDI